MKNATLLGFSIVAAVLLAAAPVAAQGDIDDEPAAPGSQAEGTVSPSEAEIIDEPYEVSADAAEIGGDETLLPFGVGFSVGGGYVGFIDEEFNDFVDPGGGWEARVLLGTDTWMGLEASYLGTSNEMEALGLSDEAYLLGNGASAALRLNLLPPAFYVRPYLSAGVGWMHYSVKNADEDVAALRDSQDVFSVPLAGGVFYSQDWLFADLRVQFAPAFDGNLTRGPFNDDTNMSTWRAVANIGFEL